MTAAPEASHSHMVYLPRESFQSLFDVLHEQGYEVIGPTVDQEAIIYDRIESVDDLPQGWTDHQEPGKYKLEHRGDNHLFGYVVGPHSWKKFVFPPETTLSTARLTSDGWQFEETQETPPKQAFLGVRACELAALQIQDRVFIGGPYVDPVYHQRRVQSLVIAVNCTQAAATCFCTSMNTGPHCTSGFDLALTELNSGFVIEVATPDGQSIADQLPTTEATEPIREAAATARAGAVDQIEKTMESSDLRDLLLDNLNHPQWDDVASRCLSCTNCTLVCPTCFCSSVEEVSDLNGEQVERRRQWDSCFNIDFSYMNGGIVRDSTRNRYRQWLTHKLATWHDQFGSSGCVGCGRCITWCPVGIDLTAEVSAIRNGDA